MAKQEAKKYFSDESVYIEKYFENPRHIEVQILSDKNRTIHLVKETVVYKENIKN